MLSGSRQRRQLNGERISRIEIRWLPPAKGKHPFWTPGWIAVTGESRPVSRIPEPEDYVLDPHRTCVLVLDLTPRPDLETPDAIEFLVRTGAFLDLARDEGAPVIFTSSLSEVGKEIVAQCRRRSDEPLFHPDAFDKMRSEEVQAALVAYGCQNLIVTGAAANHAVMNTVIGAARHFPYAVYIPMDGIHTSDSYAYEYSLYQLSHLPPSARAPHFTTLGSIAWAKEPRPHTS